jgi:hypothetical protein
MDMSPYRDRLLGSEARYQDMFEQRNSRGSGAGVRLRHGPSARAGYQRVLSRPRVLVLVLRCSGMPGGWNRLAGNVQPGLLACQATQPSLVHPTLTPAVVSPERSASAPERSHYATIGLASSLLPGMGAGVKSPIGYYVIRAAKVLWRHASLPRMRHGFNSRWPLQPND